MDNSTQKTQQETFLDKVYDLAINGIPIVDKPINKLVAEYRSKHMTTDDAIKEFVRIQKLKTTTTGFVTGLGGYLHSRPPFLLTWRVHYTLK